MENLICKKIRIALEHTFPQGLTVLNIQQDGALTPPQIIPAVFINMWTSYIVAVTLREPNGWDTYWGHRFNFKSLNTSWKRPSCW